MIGLAGAQMQPHPRPSAPPSIWLPDALFQEYQIGQHAITIDQLRSQIDHPLVAFHVGVLHKVCENYAAGDARVTDLTLDPETLDTRSGPAVIQERKAYKPQLISDG